MRWQARLRSTLRMLGSLGRRCTILGCLLPGLLAVGGCGSSKPPEPVVQEFTLRGRVESIDLARKRAVIAHQDIDGYMKAMTMPFAVPDEERLRQLKSGDQIEGRLIRDTRNNLTWLEDIRQVEGSPSTNIRP